MYYQRHLQVLTCTADVILLEKTLIRPYELEYRRTKQTHNPPLKIHQILNREKKVFAPNALQGVKGQLQDAASLLEQNCY